MTAEGPPDISRGSTGHQRIDRRLGKWGRRGAQPRGPLLYRELRRRARQHLARRAPGHTLESAGLVNKVYLKLIRAGGIRCENRVHFRVLCSQITRRILVDHSRDRGSAKRGGTEVRVSLDGALLVAPARGIGLLALDEALEKLSRIDARKGRVVELRYFGGLSVEETAEFLRISPETVKRDWRITKAWLLGALTEDQDHTSS